ncbi:MAG: PqqD family protein [Nevskiaceae bacterium]
MSLPESFACQRIRLSPRVVYQEVGGEAVLLDLESEQYFGLDAVGLRIWRLLEQHDDPRRVLDDLAAEFDAAPERIAQDLQALVHDLHEAGLVTLSPPPDAGKTG